MEMVLPGAISMCIGLSFLATAYVFETEMLTGVFDLMMFWSAASIVSSLIGASIARFLFKGETSSPEFVDTLDSIGEGAMVSESIDATSGRILYQGTWWDAFSKGETIPKDTEVTILERVDKKFLVSLTNSNSNSKTNEQSN